MEISINYLNRLTGESQYPVKTIVYWILIYTSMRVLLLTTGSKNKLGSLCAV
jgi:hypothetical protein